MTHAARPALRPPRVLALTGALAALAGAAIGTAALLHPPDSNEITAVRKMTAAPEPFPLPEADLLSMLDQPADLGPLTDAGRRSACLSALGYPGSTPVLGARPIQVAGTNAVVLLLAGEAPDEVAAVAVPGSCSAADTGLLADTVVRRR